MSQIKENLSDGFNRPISCNPSKCDSCILDEKEKWVCNNFCNT